MTDEADEDGSAEDAPAPRRPRSASASTAAAAVSKLRAALGSRVEVRAPGEAEEPILAPNARTAVFEWLQEVNAAEALKAVGLRARSTALLSGPPGCGKTTLAHHLAARLGIPLVLVGSEHLVGKYLGETGKNTAGLFDRLAEAEVPAIVFIDEIEGIGSNRNKFNGSGADNERMTAFGVLLRKIEEFRGMLIGATNRPQDLDPALWRRFGMQIAFDLPTEEERFAILRRYLLPYRLSDEDMDILTDLTQGASPALLRGLMEGVKRALVLGPRLRRDIGSAPAVFRPIVASLAPPPEMTPPPLWAGDGAEALAGLAWPPERTA